ncbi:MAG: glycosyl hydrolase [Saprospiraceae bacterium]|nr:MAG: glycosyl hydrolase [Saprospiraceae bacterium]
MKKNYLLLIMVLGGISLYGQENVNRKIEALMGKMTLEEKIGQLTLFTSGWDQTGPTLHDGYKEDVKSGRCGNLFNAHTAAYNRELQRIAIEETRLGIPLLFGYDVIHGYKTIFPIPLAEACSWDMALAEKSAHLAAKEAAAGGLHWTFNPMVDIARDPRWGRIAEGTGEDTWLGSQIAVAKVKGYQGNDLSDPTTLLACVKHFAAYGAPQAGRDYHTVDMSERVLREVYLPPYKAAIDAGVGTVMTSFNELDGVPATGNDFLMEQILRKEWGFEGFVVTDYTSINEMVPHGFSKDEKQAGEQALNAGVDMDMQGAVYQSHLAQLVKENKVKITDIDQAVFRILKMKYALGLFDDPYRYSNEEREKNTLFSKEMMDHAREAGRKSIVLLKNESIEGRPLLPLAKSIQKIALIGPLADNQEDLLGTWHAAGDASKVVTLKQALTDALPNATITYSQGCSTETDNRDGFGPAMDAAKAADVVIMAIGENYRQSGEAASRSELGLPGAQQALLEAIYQTGKPVIVVLMAGRPLTISWMHDHVPAIVNTWHLGTMAGPAIADVLTGAYNPSGKLVITFPRNVGQIPIYYNMKNTGRPFDAKNKYTSKYLDVDNTPLYPFGYGLSYTRFKYSNLKLSKSTIGFNEDLKVTITISNDGEYTGEETAQLYIRDLVGSVTRPVKELKAFQKVVLQPGESKTISFYLRSDDLRFYTRSMEYKAEAGDFKVFVGGDSADVLEADFELK